MDSFVELVVRQVLGSTGGAAAGSGTPATTAPARPNYQQQAARRRQLSQPGAPKPAAPKPAAAKPPAAPAAPLPTLPTASFFTQRLSAALPAPPKAAVSTGAEKPSSPAAAEPRPCCGNCKGCGGLVRYGQVSPKIARHLGLALKEGQHAAVCEAPASTLAQLFAANAVLAACPALAWAMDWGSAPGTPFFFRFAGSAAEVEKAAALFCAGAGAPLQAEGQTVVLRRMVKITAPHFAAIGGLGRAGALNLLNRFYLENPNTLSELMPAADGLLLAGGKQQNQTTLAGLEALLRKDGTV